MSVARPWDDLTEDQLSMVYAWLARNPPPATWQGTPFEWWAEEGPDVRTWSVRLLYRMGAFG